MITMVNQVSSVWFDNKLLIRKSLLTEINSNKCEFREKLCDFINLIINSGQDSWLKSTKLSWVGFDCRIFPLGLNTLDNARENETRLQWYQCYKQDRIYRCGEFDYIFQFQSWVCGYIYEFSLSLSFWLNYCLRWLDTVFQGQYLPSFSINYVALNKVLEKLPPQLY